MNPNQRTERDDSVSPMSGTPMDMTPSPGSSRRPTIARASSGPPGTSSLHREFLPLDDGLGGGLGEASDYLNGGLPHELPSPRNGSTAASPSGIPRVNRQPASNLQAQLDGSLPDDLASGRRSVQFARDDQVLEAPPGFGHTRQDSGDSTDAFGRSRSERFMSRLKSLAATGGAPGPKSPGLSDGFPSTASSPVATRPNRIPDTLDEEGSDADVEESGDEADGDGTGQQTPKATRRKRMRRRLKNLELRSTQNTPKIGNEIDSPGPSRFRTMVRRSTMPDATDHRGGLSEGEGRDHLTGTHRRAWGRGASWVGNPRYDTAGEEPDSPRAARMHRRRISEMFGGGGGGGVSEGDAMSPRRPLFGADRATTFGVQRWKQVKNTFKLLGGKKKTDQFDLHKSAELMAELRAVTPAVVMFASMLQRDEHGNKRIPVLLEQVKIRVLDSKPDKSDKDDNSRERHSIFTFALEYGSGPSRMTWTVERSITDIINLHARYKLSLNNQYLPTAALRKKPKQPHFPYSAFPYLRGARGADDSDEDEKAPEARGDETVAEATAGEMTAAEGTASEADRPATARRRKSRMGLLGRRQSSSMAEGLEGSNLNPQKAELEAAMKRQRFVERQRALLEKYLQEMVHWLMFRADSNRLCRFLELSALGVRLAAEGTYHGKECYLHIQSSKGIDFRRVLTPSKVIARHTRKWFLVRQNYIVVVESPSNMNIYDVYLVDPRFRIVAKQNKLKSLKGKSKQKGKEKEGLVQNDKDDEVTEDEDVSGNHHSVKIYTSERKIKLFSRNGHLMRQFDQSVNEMLKNTPWHEHQRFDSFAPVRTGVFAQWLVDGRDYMWNLSRAISMAQDVIYIHDWWLSPELYMRRPAAISHKWRLDRLLQKKAQEGVKIFVIVYRNVEQAIPIDSEYTKSSLLHLHSNIMVQRSPNQLKKNQFFYAHHEKLCIIDHDIAFLGGIDLCFGRWDSPQHPLTDDRPTGFEPNSEVPKDSEHCQMYPGKDYSNPRVLDFFKLNEPYEEMYDRSRTPRMPWHDIAMQVVGQPARDLTRHFIQRWNYLHTNHADLEQLGLSGTCEVQILRSAGDWSLGYPKDLVEHSIQNAYVELIERSDHFVYMENQFFITSTETLGTKVHNRIGDALVERIIKAHERGEDWQACIMIPLMPGFQNTVAQDSGSSVRLIMQFQYRSICRGPNSIFGRLREAGIEPEEYIQFYSLRQWGKLRNTHLVTEQLYIHAKTLIVDDRVVLIGSANINERSMLGNRDSELAAVVRDTETFWSTMAGQPYEVGRYAHSLRVRLMREHLGLPVDEITENERAEEEAANDALYESEMDHIYGTDEQELDQEPEQEEEHLAPTAGPRSLRPAPSHGNSFNHDATATEDPGFTSSESSSSEANRRRQAEAQKKDKLDAALEGADTDHWKAAKEKGIDRLRDTAIVNGHEVLLNPQHNLATTTSHVSSRESVEQNTGKGNDQLPPPEFHRQTTAELGLPRLTQLPNLPTTNDTDIGGPSDKPNPLAADIQAAVIDKDCMLDPLDPAFWDDIWNRVAGNNTKLYRRVFRCMPDSEVTTWKDYQDFEDYATRFHESMTGEKKNKESEMKGPNGQAGGSSIGVAVLPAGQNGPTGAELSEKSEGNHGSGPHIEVPSIGGDAALNEKAPVSESHDSEQPAKPKISFNPDNLNARPATAEPPSPIQPGGEIPFPVLEGTVDSTTQAQKTRDRRTTFSSTDKPPSSSGGGNPPMTATGSTRRRRRATTKGSRRGPVFPYEVLGVNEAEDLCNLVQGHLVQFPYDWLESEEKGDHWLYQADLLAPKEI
ncbi:Phospholipase [Apiospora hydei]|uniref:phospholipase D n=1 Tax=Apiospora hydei TaxID=1337664 RepID=A0ABR1WZU9_9PEZI